MTSTRWIQPINLEGESITLTPLTLDHSADLSRAIEDGDLWQLWFTTIPRPENIQQYIETALAEVSIGRSVAFAVIDNQTGNAIGTTRYCNIDHDSKRLEIGYTWYAKSYQRTRVNTEAKLLLLAHAFENLRVIAVEFRTHWVNQASRNAIARLGAKQDGILRNHKVMPDGSYRDTVVFSIINQEWASVKNHLLFKLHQTRG